MIQCISIYHWGGHEPRQARYGSYRWGEANADGAASGFPTIVLMPALMAAKWQGPPQEKNIHNGIYNDIDRPSSVVRRPSSVVRRRLRPSSVVAVRPPVVAVRGRRLSSVVVGRRSSSSCVVRPSIQYI